MPVTDHGKVTLAVVIRDKAELSRDRFMLAVTILGACLLLALVLSGMLSLFLARQFIQPIEQIAFTTKELARGNYLASTNVEDKTELGELAKQTDLLAAKLEAARQESSRLEQMQNDYISNISHELRTPVNVIRSSLEALCDGVVTGEKAVEYERQMLAECISLQRLINDMLELSRLQNRDFPIEKETMDLTMALEDALRAVRVLAKDKSIVISYEKEAESFFMEGDYGCGIPQQDLEHIFDRFYRSGQKKVKGSGLGIAIMKNIGERHNIEIRVQSVHQRGTCVSFYVPAREWEQWSHNISQNAI